MIYRACVLSRLLYGVAVSWFREGLLRRFDAKHARCVRRILGVQSTYAAKLLGCTPVSNKE
eukprot:13108664-Alexandrium_andersonii.AAC.1